MLWKWKYNQANRSCLECALQSNHSCYGVLERSTAGNTVLAFSFKLLSCRECFTFFKLEWINWTKFLEHVQNFGLNILILMLWWKYAMFIWAFYSTTKFSLTQKIGHCFHCAYRKWAEKRRNGTGFFSVNSVTLLRRRTIGNRNHYFTQTFKTGIIFWIFRLASKYQHHHFLTKTEMSLQCSPLEKVECFWSNRGKKENNLWTSYVFEKFYFPSLNSVYALRLKFSEIFFSVKSIEIIRLVLCIIFVYYFFFSCFRWMVHSELVIVCHNFTLRFFVCTLGCVCKNAIDIFSLIFV